MIFNNTSGGGEKVKINGLPPNERLNLIKYEGVYKHENLLPFAVKIHLFKQGDTHYVVSNKDNCLYKFKIGGVATKISRAVANINKNFLLIKNDKIHIAELGSAYDLSIYRLENGSLTRVLNITAANLEILAGLRKQPLLRGVFNLGEKIYLIAEVTSEDLNGSDEWYVFKNNTFNNNNWVDITKQINNPSGIPLHSLEDVNNPKFIYKNTLYCSRVAEKKIYKFDGTNLSWHKDINFVAQNTLQEGVHCNDAPFLFLLKSNGSPKVYSIFRMEEKDGVEDFYLYKEFKNNTLLNGLLVKDFNTFLYSENGSNLTNFNEYPAILFRKE